MGRRQSKTLPNWGEFLIGLGVYIVDEASDIH